MQKAGLWTPDKAGRYLCLHGLRKAVGRRLAEAGCSPHEIMATLGHRDIKSSGPYTEAYDRERSASAALKMAGRRRATSRSCGGRERTATEPATSGVNISPPRIPKKPEKPNDLWGDGGPGGDRNPDDGV